MTIINLHEGPKPTMAPDAMVFHEPRKDISPSRAIATSIAIPFFFSGVVISLALTRDPRLSLRPSGAIGRGGEWSAQHHAGIWRAPPQGVGGISHRPGAWSRSPARQVGAANDRRIPPSSRAGDLEHARAS